MTLEAGAVLARSYRLLHTIGEGGMGRVWIAEQLALDRKVAVKVLSDEAIQSQAAMELFHREARATARVDSPHVVRVLDFDVTEQGWPFLVLELLVGETLEDRVQRLTQLPLDEVREILEQTCHALMAAHTCGILHRDIKAENLFLQRGKAVDVKLLDFGIALYKTSGTITLRQLGPVGTPQYMSPEQMLAAELDERSDLFSLAVCAYYALTGYFPFPGDTVAEISCNLSRGVFTPPSAIRPGLPRALDSWFTRALAIPQDERFPTVREFLDAFDRAIEPQGRDTPVSVEVNLADLQEGWPSAVWKTIGAIAGLACVLVAIHAGIVERRAARLISATTQTTNATLANVANAAPALPIRTDVPPPPPTTAMTTDVSDAGSPPPRVASPARSFVRRATPKQAVIPGTEGFGARQ